MDKKETKTFELSLTPVSPCNLACEFCYQGGAMHDVPVESEGLRRFLEEPNINYVAETVNKLSEGYDDVIWNIFGGELLMDGIPQRQLDLYVEIMKTLQSKINKPLRACFLSNGVFTKHERIKEMLEKTNGVIAFSYDPVGRYATPEQRKLFEATYEYFRKTGHLQQLSMTLSKPTMDSLVNGDAFFEKAIKDKTIIDCCYYCESPAKMAMKYQPVQEDLERFVMWAIEKRYYFIDIIKNILTSATPGYAHLTQKHCTCGETADGVINMDGSVEFASCLEQMGQGIDVAPYVKDYDRGQEDIYSVDNAEAMNMEKFGCYYCEYGAVCPRTCSASMLNPKMSNKCFLKNVYKRITDEDRKSFIEWLEKDDAENR